MRGYGAKDRARRTAGAADVFWTSVSDVPVVESTV
jgi:hypothetical protein